jgi:cytochrome c-type biogenesis protein CcmH
MPPPSGSPHPRRLASLRTLEQVTEMNLSNRVLDFALKGRGFSRAVETSFSNFREGYSASGPQRLKPHRLRRTLGAPEGAPFQNKTLSRASHTLLLTAAIFLFIGAGDDSARFKDLGHRMICACGCGQILLECNHVGCTYSDKMRNQLLAALDKGDNDDLIVQGFVQDYGPTVIAAPTATGFNRVAWIMPFVALALGIAFVVYVVRSWKNRPAPALADGIAIPPGSELEEFRRKARRETDQ